MSNDYLSEHNLCWRTIERAVDDPELNFAKIRSPLWLEREKRLEQAKYDKVLARVKARELANSIR